MAQEDPKRLVEWLQLLRGQIPVIRERAGVWIAAVREEPVLLWETPGVRYAVYTVGVVILLWVASTISGSLVPPPPENAKPVATKATRLGAATQRLVEVGGLCQMGLTARCSVLYVQAISSKSIADEHHDGSDNKSTCSSWHSRLDRLSAYGPGTRSLHTVRGHVTSRRLVSSKDPVRYGSVRGGPRTQLGCVGCDWDRVRHRRA